jgi:WD40 repeat protein
MKMSFAFIIVGLFLVASARASGGTCSDAVMIVERIKALQSKIDLKIESGDTEGIRALYTALQTRIRLAKQSGIDVTGIENRKSKEAARIQIAEREATEADARDASAFSPLVRSDYYPTRNLSSLNFYMRDFSIISDVTVDQQNGARNAVVFETKSGKVLVSSSTPSPWSLSPNGKYGVHYEQETVDRVVSHRIVLQELKPGGRRLVIPTSGRTLRPEEGRNPLVIDDRGRFVGLDRMNQWQSAELEPSVSPLGEVMKEMMSGGEEVRYLQLSRNGKFIIKQTEKNGQRETSVWNVETGEKQGTANLVSYDRPTLSDDGTTFAEIYLNNYVQLYDVTSGQPIDRFKVPGPPASIISAMAFGDDSRSLFVAMTEAPIVAYDHIDEPPHFIDTESDITQLRYVPEMRTLSGLGDSTITIWTASP